MDWGHEGRKIGEEKHCENGKERTKEKKKQGKIKTEQRRTRWGFLAEGKEENKDGN